MRWAVRLLVCFPLVVTIAVELIVVAQAGRPATADPLPYVADSTTGVLLVAAGLVAHERRPASAAGRLLMLAGYAWFVGDFMVGTPMWVAVPSYAFHGYYDVILAFVVLSFPTGRLSSRVAGAVIVVLGGVFVARSIVRLVGPLPTIDYLGPGVNPYELFDNLDVAHWLDLHALFPVAACLAAVPFLALIRWRGATGAGRRVQLPVLVAGSAGAVLSALLALEELLYFDAGFDILPLPAPWYDVSAYLVRILVPLGFIVGAAQLRRGRSSFVDLVAGIDTSGTNLGYSLARALNDPSVVLLRATPSGWSHEDGSPAVLPGPANLRAVTELRSGGETVGAIVHDPALLEDPSLVRTVAATVGLAIDNERLRLGLETQLAEVSASRTRIVEAADEERRRIERDLHDGAQQRLVTLAITLRMLHRRLGPNVDAAVAAELTSATLDVQAAIDELRDLARGLDPVILREAGLRQALESLAGRSTIPVEVSCEVAAGLPAKVERTAYFVVAEALANVAKHSGATSASVRAARVDGHLRVEVSDNGRGGAAPVAGSGLSGLFDRLAAVGGTMTMESPPGGGTRLVAEVPCG